MSVTLAVFQPERSSDWRLEQSENIFSIVVTLAVFQPERLSDWRSKQPENISVMLVTLSGTHSDIPSIVARLLHSLNRQYMSVTLAVFQPVRLSEVSPEQ